MDFWLYDVFLLVWINCGGLSCLIGDFWILISRFVNGNLDEVINFWLIIFDVMYVIFFCFVDKDLDVVLCLY